MEKLKYIDMQIYKHHNLIREDPKLTVTLLQEKLVAFQTRTKRGSSEKHAPRVIATIISAIAYFEQ